MDILVSQSQSRVAVTVLELKGDLDSSSFEQFDKRVKELVQAGAKNVLLDMRQVNYMSSAGMRSLSSLVNLLHNEKEIQALRQAALTGATKSPHLKLAGVTKNVHSVLQMTGMDTFLDIRKDQKEALAAF